MNDQEKGVWGYKRSELPEHWPVNSDGHPEGAALLIAAQSELGGGADILLSMLEGCGIPAFKSGSLGKVIMGFAGQGVDIYVPLSRLEEAKGILDQSTDPCAED